MNFLLTVMIMIGAMLVFKMVYPDAPSWAVFSFSIIFAAIYGVSWRLEDKIQERG